MSFDELLRAGRIRPQPATRQDVHLLLCRARLQSADARVEATSLDGRFTAAYHAALNLATIPLLASGFRPSGAGHHVTIVAGLTAAFGPTEGDFAKMLDRCRVKRNEVLYDSINVATEDDIKELADAVVRFERRVLAWLAEQHPELLPEADGGLRRTFSAREASKMNVTRATSRRGLPCGRS